MATKNKDKGGKKEVAAVQATVKVNDKVAKAIEVIKEHHPHVKTAYFNADGEFHFHKRPGFKAVPIHDDEDIELEAPAIGDEDADEDDDQPIDLPGGKLEF